MGLEACAVVGDLVCTLLVEVELTAWKGNREEGEGPREEGEGSGEEEEGPREEEEGPREEGEGPKEEGERRSNQRSGSIIFSGLLAREPVGMHSFIL